MRETEMLKKVREALRSKRVTTYRLAKESGIAHATLWEIAFGASNPRTDTLARAHRALGRIAGSSRKERRRGGVKTAKAA